MNHTHRAILFAALFLTLTRLASGQNEQPLLKVGDPAPALHIDELLQTPAGAGVSEEALKGKIVVIDFWATWCTPCVASLPHISSLAAEFSKQPVVFVSVTDDDPEKLAGFFKTHPLGTWVGIDRKRANWRAFDVVSIPHAVIIGRDGKVAAITFPENITSESIRQLLRGESIALPSKEGRPDNLEWDHELIDWKDGVPPLLYALIKPIKTSTGGSWIRPEGDRLTADGVPLSVLIGMAFKVDRLHLDLRLPASKQTYRVAVRVPAGREAALLPLFQQSLVAMFDLVTRSEIQERDVLILRHAATAPSLSPSTAAQGLVQSMRGKITLKKQTTKRLSEFLSEHLGTPVLDETGLKETYDFELPYQPGDAKVLTDALEALGFQLEKTRRPLAILVVEKSPD